MQRDNKVIKHEEETNPLGKLILQSKDHYSLFAKHLPRKDRSSLRQTCRRANAFGVIYEFNLHHSPKLLLEQMRSMDKKEISLLLRENFAAESKNYPLMRAKALELPKDPYAIAFFALIGPVTEINHEDLKLAYDFLSVKGFAKQSCVMQSIAFQLEWNNIKLKHTDEAFLIEDRWQRKLKLVGAMWLHPSAYYNFRGANLSHLEFDYDRAPDFALKSQKLMLDIDDAASSVIPDFSWASFTGANLTKSWFRGLNMVGADFHRVKMRNVNFWRSNLGFCNMDAVVIYNDEPDIDLDDSWWVECDFTGATLSNINFGKPHTGNRESINVQSCIFRGASFENSVLGNVSLNLNNDNLEGVNFCGASLVWQRFNKGVNLKGANFKNANLSNATFDGVSLDGVLNLDQADLTQARYDSRTTFPYFTFFPTWHGMINLAEKNEAYPANISKQNCVMM